MTKAQILIVEDEILIAEGLRHKLEYLGYTVPGIVTSGEEAVRQAGEIRPHLVLMDIMLRGEMDGIQAAELIRTRFDIPVVYLTANAGDDLVQRAKITEPFGYILKPYEPRELVSTIDTALYRHEITQKLRASEERFRLMAEISPDLIFQLDLEGRITYCSPAIEQVLDFQPQEVIGTHLRRFFPPAGQAQAMHNFGRVVAAERLEVAEAKVLNRAGTLVPVEITLVPIIKDRHVTGVQGVARDITERTRTEAALKERVKELNCLYGISTLVEQAGTSLPEILDGIVALIPPAWQYPQITCARISLADRQVATGNWQETPWQLAHDLLVAGRPAGQIQVGYLEERPEAHEGPFLKEEKDLIRAIAERLGRIVERIQAESQREAANEELKHIEWLLTQARFQPAETYEPPYGDLTVLNERGEILHAVGPAVLHDIVDDYLRLLGTSAAVYEKNGDYALGIFSSGWCRLMDQASHQLCQTEDNVEALNSGRWLCHESCWTEASQVAIERDRAVDIECQGGIRLYAEPIRAGGTIVGAINFGYSDPPRDEQTLGDLAARYEIDIDLLREQSAAYESRPPFIVEIAKERLLTSARLIGEIVERKRAEEELQRLYEQTRRDATTKATLLQEIHHRVKNNLQIVVTLLDLQSDATKDEETRQAFLETQNRIQAMTRVHEQLYRATDLAQIDMGNYMEKLLSDLCLTYAAHDLVYRLDAGDLRLPIEQALPCGMIVSELTTNALKHAFPAGQEKRIDVEMAIHGDECLLLFADEGVGLPADLDLESSETLGLQLVQVFARQLGGELDIEHTRPQRTTFRVSFPRQ